MNYKMTKNETYKDDFETYKSWLNAADADKHIPLSFLFSDNVQNIDLSNYSNNHIPLSENADLVLRESVEEAKILGYDKVDDRHLFLALIKTGKKDINQLIQILG